MLGKVRKPPTVVDKLGSRPASKEIVPPIPEENLPLPFMATPPDTLMELSELAKIEYASKDTLPPSTARRVKEGETAVRLSSVIVPERSRSAPEPSVMSPCPAFGGNAESSSKPCLLCSA